MVHHLAFLRFQTTIHSAFGPYRSSVRGAAARARRFGPARSRAAPGRERRSARSSGCNSPARSRTVRATGCQVSCRSIATRVSRHLWLCLCQCGFISSRTQSQAVGFGVNSCDPGCPAHLWLCQYLVALTWHISPWMLNRRRTSTRVSIPRQQARSEQQQ